MGETGSTGQKKGETRGATVVTTGDDRRSRGVKGDGCRKGEWDTEGNKNEKTIRG